LVVILITYLSESSLFKIALDADLDWGEPSGKSPGFTVAGCAYYASKPGWSVPLGLQLHTFLLE
jgi:hypothetical protein